MRKMFYWFWGWVLMLLLLPGVVGAAVSGNVSAPDPTLSNPLTTDSITGILDKVVDFLLTLAAPIAVVMTIYAGYLFLTAGDKQEQVKTARQTLLYVVIGVAVLILSKGIVSLVNSFL